MDRRASLDGLAVDHASVCLGGIEWCSFPRALAGAKVLGTDSPTPRAPCSPTKGPGRPAMGHGLNRIDISPWAVLELDWELSTKEGRAGPAR